MARIESATACCRVERTLDGFITCYEKPVLRQLAACLPASVLPDHLTILGLLGAVVVSISLCASNIAVEFAWLAALGLVINWLGDSLDGTLARLRGIERPRYGFFIDHLADVASLFLIAIGLGLSPFLRLDVGCLALIGYLVLMIFTLVKLHVLGTMQLTFYGVGPTEVRVVLGIGLVLAASTEAGTIPTPAGDFSLFDGAALLVFAFSLGSAAMMFARHHGQLAKLEPQPSSAGPTEDCDRPSRDWAPPTAALAHVREG